MVKFSTMEEAVFYKTWVATAYSGVARFLAQSGLLTGLIVFDCWQACLPGPPLTMPLVV